MEIKRYDFEDWAYAAGITGDDIRLAYSGRGMYGKTCPGIVGDHRKLTRFLIEAAARVGTDTAVTLSNGYSSDDMGGDSIFYWRGVKLVG